MRTPVTIGLAMGLVTGLSAGCGGGLDASREPGSHTSASIGSRADEEAAVRDVLDAWHEAAARSDEEGYFARMTPDAIFLGTDATERWSRDELRAYAHGPFSEGRGWRMHATRRDVVIASGPIGAGSIAWFDEDLETVNLGPARGSGVLVRDDLGWRIVQYNLAITVPNPRFGEVRALLAAPAPSPPPPPAPDDAQVPAR